MNKHGTCYTKIMLSFFHVGKSIKTIHSYYCVPSNISNTLHACNPFSKWSSWFQVGVCLLGNSVFIVLLANGCKSKLQQTVEYISFMNLPCGISPNQKILELCMFSQLKCGFLLSFLVSSQSATTCMFGNLLIIQVRGESLPQMEFKYLAGLP